MSAIRYFVDLNGIFTLINLVQACFYISLFIFEDSILFPPPFVPDDLTWNLNFWSLGFSFVQHWTST